MDTSKKSSVSTESVNTFSQPHTILFVVQVVLIFIVVCASLINLTLEIGNQNLWTVILTSCLGIIMPNPRLKMSNGSRENESAVSGEQTSSTKV